MYLILVSTLLISCSITGPAAPSTVVKMKCKDRKECLAQVDELCGPRKGHLISLGAPEEYTYAQCTEYVRASTND